MAAGANVKVVQRMLGHASAAMTLDVYAGLFADDLDSVAERLDAAAAQSRADSLRTADILSLTEARMKRHRRTLTCGNTWWAPSGSNRRPTD